MMWRLCDYVVVVMYDVVVMMWPLCDNVVVVICDVVVMMCWKHLSQGNKRSHVGWRKNEE